MRITNGITHQGALRSLLSNQQQIHAASQRVSTGLRFTRASEDPTAASSVMRASGSLRAVEQYRRNIGAATVRVEAEEEVLDQLSDILVRARELAIQQGSGTASAETRLMVKAEVDELLRSAITLAGTRVQDGYLFGGDTPTAAPFAVVEGATLDFTTTSPTGELAVEIASGQTVSTAHDGTTVFGPTASGPLAALRELAQALHADDVPGISAASRSLEVAFDDTQALLGTVGARANQLQVTTANLDALAVTLKTFKADVSEIDFETAVTELVSRQTAYQAAMMASSRVLGMTLTDYLR